MLYAATMTVITSVLGSSVETGIVLFYGLILLIAVLPGLPGNDNKVSFLRLLKLCFFPGTTISFSEVLLADALTSLSKVFKDIGITAVVVYSQQARTDIIDHHDFGMILVAVLASTPFV
jgi:EXS family